MFLDERGCVIWYHCAFKFMLECQHSSNYTFKSTTNFNLVRKKWFTLCFDNVPFGWYISMQQKYIFIIIFKWIFSTLKSWSFLFLLKLLFFVLFLSCCTTVDCLNIVIVKWFSSHTWLKMIKNLVVMEYSRYIIRYSVLDIYNMGMGKISLCILIQILFQGNKATINHDVWCILAKYNLCDKYYINMTYDEIEFEQPIIRSNKNCF